MGVASGGEFAYMDALCRLRINSAPHRSTALNERRESLRFDKVFTVYLSTADGMTRGIARNISTVGLFVETRDSLPLGGRIKVTFSSEDGTEMTALCEVRYQVALNYGDGEDTSGTRGAGLRIIAYETKEDQPLLLLDRERVLH